MARPRSSDSGRLVGRSSSVQIGVHIGGTIMGMTCSVEACDRPSRAMGMCKSHWANWKATGVVPVGPLRPYRQVCGVPGCSRPHKAKGWCELHGSRVKSTGDPLVPGRIGPVGPLKAQVTIRQAHRRVERQRGKASAHPCSRCSAAAADWAYDWQDEYALEAPNGSLYSLDPGHYLPLCKSCHLRFDHWRRPKH